MCTTHCVALCQTWEVSAVSQEGSEWLSHRDRGTARSPLPLPTHHPGGRDSVQGIQQVYTSAVRVITEIYRGGWRCRVLFWQFHPYHMCKGWSLLYIVTLSWHTMKIHFRPSGSVPVSRMEGGSTSYQCVALRRGLFSVCQTVLSRLRNTVVTLCQQYPNTGDMRAPLIRTPEIVMLNNQNLHLPKAWNQDAFLFYKWVSRSGSILCVILMTFQ